MTRRAGAKALTVRVPEKLLEELQAHAKNTGVRMQTLVETYIVYGLHRDRFGALDPAIAKLIRDKLK